MHKLTTLVVPFFFIAVFAHGAAGPTSLLCATEFNGQEKSKIVVKAESGQTLFVCGKIRKVKGANELSTFKVFVIGKSGKKLPGFAMEDTSAKSYRVVNTVGSLTLQELLPVGKDNIPAYEIEVACTEKSCKPAPAKCIFTAPKGASMKALGDVKAYTSGPKKGKVPPVKLIDSLARLAYSGNEEALKIFENRGSLSLDGDVSDAYFDQQATIKKLKKDGCLPGQ